MEKYEPKTIKEVLELVYDALEEKAYNPIAQITGYLLSEDPAYITTNRGARRWIGKFNKDEYMEELLRSYLNK